MRQFSVTLSAAIDPATLVAGAVTITGQSGGDQSALIQSLAADAQALTVTVTLAAPLPDADVYTIALTDVLHSAAGQTITGDRDLTLRVLAGDVHGSGTVTAADILAACSQSGLPLSAATARYDLNASGSVTGDDLLAIRARLGRQLP